MTARKRPASRKRRNQKSKETTMKFQIKNRFTDSVQFECELAASYEQESDGVKLGAAVKLAVKADADLADANLAGANLARAYLARANLAARNLTKEQIASANTEPASDEEIARLDAVREIVVNKPQRLAMGDWHSRNWTPDHTPEEEHSCGSAHCIAGWLQALSPDPEIRRMHAAEAGRKLAPASSFMFFTSDAVALQWLTDRAYAKDRHAK